MEFSYWLGVRDQPYCPGKELCCLLNRRLDGAPSQCECFREEITCLAYAGKQTSLSQVTQLMFYAFFWVIPWRLNCICQRFRTLCLFHLHRQVVFFIPTHLWRWNRQSVPKRLHLKFRCQGITQKKAYNIQNMTEVWNKELFTFVAECGACEQFSTLHFGNNKI